MDNNVVITISRQFGSGGHEIGKKLSEKMGIKFYDKDLILMAAEKSGMSKEIFESMDETMSSPFFQPIAAGMRFSIVNDVPINDKIFFAESDVIRQLAQTQPCIIVGRCADYVLRERPHTYNVFVYADRDFRIGRLKAEFDLTDAAAKEVSIKTDKRRAAYYNYYSAKDWGKAASYHLSLDSGFIGVDKAVEVISHFVTVAENK